MSTKREERLKAEVEGRSLVQERLDRRARLEEYERQMVSGEKHSPSAQRIIDQMKKYLPPPPPPEPEGVSARDAQILATELLITEGVEVITDAPMFELSSEKEPER